MRGEAENGSDGYTPTAPSSTCIFSIDITANAFAGLGHRRQAFRRQYNDSTKRLLEQPNHISMYSSLLTYLKALRIL